MNQQYRPLTENGEPAEKLTKWEKEPQLRELVRDVEQARPAQREHIARIDKWLSNLNITGSAKFQPPKGRSGIQPKLIRKQAEWRYSSLSEPLLSAEKIYTVNPVSWNDKASAEQNELLLNWQFTTKIDLVTFVDKMIHTLVDEGTVVVRTGWNRETVMEKQDAPVYTYYAVQDPEQGQALQEAMELQKADPAAFSALAEDIQESVRYSVETGVFATAVQTGTEQIEVEKVIHNHPTVDVINTANLVVDATCEGDITKAMFMAYSYEITRAKLEQDKRYKNLKHINWGRSVLAEPDHQTNSPAEISFEQESRQKVVMIEYYGLYDIKGDDHLVPILACWVGNVLVRLEENPFPDGSAPFTIIPYMPIKDSVFGEPDGELLIDNQKIQGALTRGIIDTFARTSSGQRGMAKGMLDVTNQRRFERGEDYFYNPNVSPQNSLIEHKFPELPMSAMQMANQQSLEAESLTGVKMFDDGLNSGSLGKVAAGINGALDAANRREMAILRRIAKGMAIIGSKILAMNQEFLSEEEVIRVTEDEFIPIRRDDIQGRYDMAVEISTAGEDEMKAGRLEFMLQTMGPKGDPELTKMILTEIARLRRMPHLAHHIKNYVPQPDPLQVKMQELQIAELEAKVQKAQAEAQEAMSRAQLNMAKVGQTEAETDKTNLDFVEQESGTAHARDMDKQGGQAQGNIALEVVKGAVKSAVPTK